MPRFHRRIPIDDYVLDILMPDLVGHDHQPAAFLGTGLSKSSVQIALERLRSRELIRSKSAHATALPQHHVLRHWRQPVRR